MPRVVGIDHLVLSVGDFARSKAFYDKLLKFLGFKLKHEYGDMAGWSNGKTLFWIAAADAQGRKHKYRKGDIGFHHYAFELASRKDVDDLGAFLEKNDMTVVDPPGEYYGDSYYAVYFADPDGMKLEAMIWAPPEEAQTEDKRARRTSGGNPRRQPRRRRRRAHQGRSIGVHAVAAASLGGIERASAASTRSAAGLALAAAPSNSTPMLMVTRPHGASACVISRSSIDRRASSASEAIARARSRPGNSSANSSPP